jgi:hypothetical protein
METGPGREKREKRACDELGQIYFQAKRVWASELFFKFKSMF